MKFRPHEWSLFRLFFEDNLIHGDIRPAVYKDLKKLLK